MGIFMKARLLAVKKISKTLMHSKHLPAATRDKFRNINRISELYLKGKDMTREEMDEILDFIDKQSKREN